MSSVTSAVQPWWTAHPPQKRRLPGVQRIAGQKLLLAVDRHRLLARQQLEEGRAGAVGVRELQVAVPAALDRLQARVRRGAVEAGGLCPCAVG